MAINKAMMAALKALSYPDADVRLTYPVERKLAKFTAPAIDNPKGMNIENRFIDCAGRQIPVRVFNKKYGKSSGVFVFFHGGGWVSGNMDSYSGVCANMADRTGHTVIAVDYRLAPENKFPCGLEDCYDTAREIYVNRELFGFEPSDITLIGDSAGGNLCAAVSLMARDRGDFLPERQILIYPAVNNDHSETSQFASIRENGTDYLLTSKRVRRYLQMYASSAEDFNNPYFAPLLAENFSNQPRTLIITAEFCPLRDEGEEYGKRLRAAGNQVEICRLHDALHGFISLSWHYKHVRQTYRLIERFLNK